MIFIHHTVCGVELRCRLRCSARKNIIVRPDHDGGFSINVPPGVPTTYWQAWLRQNEAQLLRLWRQSCQPPTLPDRLWFQGGRQPCRQRQDNAAAGVVWTAEQGFSLPPGAVAAVRAGLRGFLQQQAAAWLLPALALQAAQMAMTPPPACLSAAKTFWGVCRGARGIRLNWRLVGAPDWVVAYVCVHELAHLRHPDHSPAFWAQVARHHPRVAEAKHWLRQHGSALFALG